MKKHEVHEILHPYLNIKEELSWQDILDDAKEKVIRKLKARIRDVEEFTVEDFDRERKKNL